MKKILITASFLLAILIYVPTSFAGTNAGDMELGTQFSYNSQWGDLQPDQKSFVIAGKVSYFVKDDLSVGVVTSGNFNTSDTGDSSALFFELEPNWHFMTNGMVIPYIGPHSGFQIFESGVFSDTMLTYGFQGGVKAFIAENAAIDSQLRYTRYERDSIGEPTNNFGLFVGLNIYF